MTTKSAVSVTVDGRTERGPGVDLRDEGVDAETVLDAVGADSDEAETADDGGAALRVECPSPGDAHGTLGHVDDSRPRSRRRLLAAAARSLGYETPEMETCERLRDELAACRTDPVETPALAEARRRCAAAGERQERLRERVATLRGRLQARRDVHVETDAVETELATAFERLAEVETERIAAEQALDAERRRAADTRVARERRFALEDRLANAERAARARLADAVYPAFAAAVEALPVDAEPGESPSAFVGDPPAAHLAAIRVAALDAPVVSSVAPLGDAAATARWLQTPVILV